MRVNFKVFFLLILLLTAWNLPAETKLVEQYISWGAIEGAWGYEVIIRQGEEEIVRTQIREAEYTFSLLPGEYEIQIAVLNKFKNTVNSTDWQPLVIREALQPVIRDFTPREYFLRSEGDLLLTAQVYQAVEDSQFFLIDEEKNRTAGKITSLEGETVELHFDLNTLTAGNYMLYILNPSGLEDLGEATPLTLHPVIKPEIKDVSLRDIQQQQVYNDIEVRGKNFEKTIEVRITRQGQEFTPYEVKWQSGELLLISLITGNRPPGRYSLELINPSGESDLKKNAFFMEEAPEMIEIRHTPPSDTFSVLGGYNFAVSLDQSHGDSDPIPFGLLLKARHELVNSRFWKATGLRPLGVELAVNSSHLDYKNAPFVYSELFTGFFMYYQVKLTKGWSLIPRLGMGVSYLWVNEDGIFGEPIQGDTGISFGGGSSLQKIWQSGVLIESGFDFRFTSYTGGSFFSMYPWIAGGYRF
ncbi:MULTISPECIES: hypothetical protein [unclassified Oceanispirochaeta]|uniref:hypothetical protein n=1 Tax=unclassified Oceanispirochaeta TaxID=2635722 RepID=UPI000E09B369|nr:MULTISPECIES: hypothetical protein [unclassified Oceanispirochaeta]MBF9017100.1 hypothetical protein [Oceanispirochaeta sp. M2]NPD73549.1 hypothetical protein [Oceanispirochaeta sp. M1]RDG30654.1 hypothetical protein DV872_15745 [Oceanispirochaeta sp. M1]